MVRKIGLSGRGCGVAVEAGKSTALAAFLDLLFGIELRSRFGFRHPYSSMEIGGALELGGRVHELVRVKRAQNDLLDAAGRPVSAGLIAGQLGGIDREAYRAMFSLDDETLEAGGESILASRGDLGQLLFSASTGLADLSNTLTALRAGRDYALVVLSIDPAETSADANAAKMQDVSAYGLSGAEHSLHYLTGSTNQIQAVADAIGFRDRLDQQTKQFVHPAGVVFVTPGGVISSYLLGVGYTPTDIRSEVHRADLGSVAAAGSPVLLLCFHFDPATGRYTLEILKLLRLAAVLTLATVGGTLFLLFRRERTGA